MTEVRSTTNSIQQQTHRRLRQKCNNLLVENEELRQAVAERDALLVEKDAEIAHLLHYIATFEDFKQRALADIEALIEKNRQVMESTANV